MRLLELCKDLPYEELRGGDVEINSLCTDSRVADRGDLYFCFRGTHVDSHRFAWQAEERGVSAVVCEHDTGVHCPQLIVKDGREAMARICAAFYRHPEQKLKLLAVTGTNGKTTTAHILRSILEEAGFATGIIGTLGAEYAQNKVEPELTTPDPVFLFSLLADMQKAGMEYVVTEASAHALALKKLCPIKFEGAIFTNLTQDHLDFFGDMQTYGAAKAKLFTPECSKFGVINADDQFSSQLLGKIPTVTYGLNEPSDVFAVIEEETVRGSRVMLNLNDELCETEIPLTGRHNLYNAMGAAALARHLGANTEEIALGIAHTPVVSGRLEWVAKFRGGDIFVDFAHTPDGLLKSLTALKPHCRGKLICLFGCGGNRDTGKRIQMGEIAAKYCDFCVITADNPRYEDPCAISAKIEEGYCRYSKRYVVVEEREKGTEFALKFLSEGDILLVAGKGGETYQEIMGIKYAYDDKAVIKKLIGKLQS